MVPKSEELLILDASDFDTPEAPEPLEGISTFHHVWIHPGEFGLYDSNGMPILESFLRRGPDLRHYPHGSPKSIYNSTSSSICGEEMERIVYLPHAGMSHFGHLLTECAAYLGPLLEHPAGLDGIGGPGAVLVLSPRFAQSSASVAELLGVPWGRVTSTASLATPVKCIQAVVPLPSMMNRHSLSRQHFRHVRKLLEHLHGCGDQLAVLGSKIDQGEKLYLSRSQMPSTARHTIAEEELEANLVELGWRIVFPEQLSISRQLDCLAAARTVAGCLGSALHLLMAFGESVGNRRVITLGPTAAQARPNVFLQARRQQLPLRHMVCLEQVSAECKNLRFLLPPAQVASKLNSLANDFSW